MGLFGGDDCQSAVVGYRYSVGMHMALCHAADEFYAINTGDYQAWQSGGAGEVTASQGIVIDQPTLYGGQGQEGGVSGAVDLLFGEAGQLPNDYLSSKIGTVPAYRGVVSVVLRQVYIGDSTYIKPWSFLLRRTSTSDGWLPSLAVIGACDMNPAHIIRECLTNTAWGMGYPVSDLDDAAFAAAASALYAEEFGLSLLWDQATDLEGFIQETLKHIDGVLFLDQATGLFSLRLLRADYDPAQLPILDSSVVVEVRDYSRRTQNELVNTVVLTYLENLTSFTQAIPWAGTKRIGNDNSPYVSASADYVACNRGWDTRDLRVYRRGAWAETWDLVLDDAAKNWEGMAFSPNGRWLVCAVDGAPGVIVWDATTWSQVPGTPALSSSWPIGEVAWARSGELVAVGLYAAGGMLYVLDGYSWQIVAALSLGTGYYIESLAMSPDGRFVGLRTSDDFRLYELIYDPTETPYKYDVVGATPAGVPGGEIEAVAIDHGLIAFAMRTTGEVRVYSFPGFAAVATITGPIYGKHLAFSPDGRYLAVAGSHTGAGNTRLIATATWQYIDQPLTAETSPGFTYSSAFAPGSDILAVGGSDECDVFVMALPPEGTPATTVPAPDVEKSITVHSLGQINAMGGDVVSHEISMPGISKPALAARVAARELAKLSAELSAATLACNRAASALRVGDPFRFVWPAYGVAGEVMRVTDIDLGSLADGVVTIHAVQEVLGPAAGLLGAPAQGGWVDPVSEPAAAPERLLVEAPYWYWARTVGEYGFVWAEIDAASAQVLTLARPPAGDALDYSLYSRPAGAAEYTLRQAGRAFAETALLSEDVGKTETVLPVDDAALEIPANAYAYLDEELVGVVAADPAAGTITVLRGVLDTVPEPHQAGSRLWIAARQAADGVEYFTGETVSVKVLPRTAKGALAMELAPADSLTCAGRMIRPYPPGNFRLPTGFAGDAYPYQLAGDPIQVAWSHRDRLQQTAYLVAQDESDIGPEAGTTYSLRLLDGAGVEVYAAGGIPGNSHLIPDAGLTDGFYTVELSVARDGYQGWQQHVHRFLFLPDRGSSLTWGTQTERFLLHESGSSIHWETETMLILERGTATGWTSSTLVVGVLLDNAGDTIVNHNADLIVFASEG